MEFTPTSVIINFDKPRLLKTMWRFRDTTTPNFIHTTGIFLALECCRVVDGIGYQDNWDKFLNLPDYASPLRTRHENEWQQLIVEWDS
jgi:hypothetical protein